MELPSADFFSGCISLIAMLISRALITVDSNSLAYNMDKVSLIDSLLG